MSLGRWLLTHSLSLFLTVMLLAAWFFRDELELDRAWAQLRQVGSEMEAVEIRQQPDSAKEAKELEAEHSPQTQEPADSRPSAPASSRDSAAASGENPEAMLAAARSAFWSRDFERAISLYERLIKQYPDNPDYIGELGNIHYNLNRFDRAAEEFLRAGLLLVEQGATRRARQLLPALKSLDREKGAILQQNLEHATGQPVESQS